MKKIITTALIAAMLTASLAGCSGSTNSGDSGVNSGNSGTSSGTSSTNSGTSSTNSGTSSTDSNTSSDAANSGDTGSSGGDSSAPTAEGKAPAVRLQAMFNGFPQFFDVNSEEGFMSMIVAGPDAAKIKEVFPDPADPEKPTHCVFGVEESATLAPMMQLTQLNLEDCEDYILAAPMMSASLKQIVIAKPKAGKEDAVKTALSQFAEVAKQPQPMEYPAWEEERAGTHFGETADGCFYVVVAAEGADMGAAIENA